MKIIYNNRVMDKNDVKISALGNGFNYGEGFFTTIKVIDSQPENLKLHNLRIKNSLSFFNFDFNLPDLNKLINQIIECNNLSDARLKLTIFKDTNEISFILFCEKLIITKATHSLIFADFVRGNNPIFKYKCLNYYSNLKSKNMILFDYKKRILETGFANIFIIKGNNIYTPPKYLSLLPGIYREYLLSMKKINNYTISEKELFKEDIINCDGIFITNSIRGIEPVFSVETKNIPTALVEQLIGNLQNEN